MSAQRISRRQEAVTGEHKNSRSGRSHSTEQSSEEVYEILNKASYIVIFSVPEPGNPPIGHPLIPFISQIIHSITVIEAPRRFQLSVTPPTAECGFRTRKTISQEQVAKMHFTLDVIPNNWEPGIGRIPPPTILIPYLSQRAYMFNGHFDFLDGLGSGFRAMAAARFFPARVNGKLQVRFGGAIDILEGFGQLQGVIGNFAINGYTTPPADFAMNFIVRLVDLPGKFRSESPLPPIDPPLPDPDPETAFIPLKAEPHPDYPVVVEPSANGKKLIHIVERLRVANTSFDVAPGLIKSRIGEGPVVGEHRTTLVFDPDYAQQVIPVYSVDSLFTFFAEGRRPIGTLRANLFEGRAFKTSLPELEQHFFRVVGFGPFIEGTGQFKGAIGMVSTNGALSLTPGALSAMYMLRVSDPEGRFQSPWAPR